MNSKETSLKNALASKKIPVLTLDNKWHRLCAKTAKTSIMVEYEKRVNELLCQQGKINTKLKSVRPLKKKLLDELVIMASEMEEHPNKGLQLKINEHKKLIAECNDKLELYRDEMLDMPKLIKEANEVLMFETMKVCYDKLQGNNGEIHVIEEWLSKMRIELKKNVIKKQEMEMLTNDIYHYMHDVFGAEVIELFDFNQETYGEVLEDKQVDKPIDETVEEKHS